MTDQNSDLDNKQPDSEEQTQPAPRQAFVPPPYRERVHSRKLQGQEPAQEQQPAQETQQEIQQEAPQQADVANAPPDMSAYLSRRSFGGASGQFPIVVPDEIQAVPEIQQVQETQTAAAPTEPLFNQFFVEEKAPTIDPRESAYIEAQELALQRPAEEEVPVKPTCRHEYVRIFQRKLKDLNRRMVCTKAYLPVGFKMGDFQHLGENSFCFCATCRARLYPKRSQAEKAEARIQLAQGKALKLEQQSMMSADLIEEVGTAALKKLLMHVDDNEDDDVEEAEDETVTSKVDIHVEEMEQEGVGVEDLDVEGLKGNQEEDSSEMSDQEEM